MKKPTFPQTCLVGVLVLIFAVAGYKNHADQVEEQARNTPEAKAAQRVSYAVRYAVVDGAENPGARALRSGDFKQECAALGGSRMIVLHRPTAKPDSVCDVQPDSLEFHHTIVGQDTLDDELEGKVYVAYSRWVDRIRAENRKDQRRLDYIDRVANGKPTDAEDEP